MPLLIGDLITVVGKWTLYHYYVYVGPIGPQGEDLFHVDTRNGAELIHSSRLDREEVVCTLPQTNRQNAAAIQRRALQLLGKPYHPT